jgi:hypothetical protein
MPARLWTHESQIVHDNVDEYLLIHLVAVPGMRLPPTEEMWTHLAIFREPSKLNRYIAGKKSPATTKRLPGRNIRSLTLSNNKINLAGIESIITGAVLVV